MSKLPEGWTWREGRRGFLSHETDSADLYAPHGCHAGEVRPSNYGKEFYSHTWDEDGTGGENSVHKSLEEAKLFVEEAILRQGFHMECDLNCSDRGDEEYAAEVAAEHWEDLDETGREALASVVEAMLGPKRYREWCEENGVEEENE